MPLLKKSSISCALLLAFTLLGLSTQQVETYDEKLGLTSLHYSAAAYCLNETLATWDCGEACTLYKNNTKPILIQNHAQHTLAFATYDPDQDMIVIAFRGSNGMDYKNWYTNFHGAPISFNELEFPGAKIHEGFYTAYSAIRDQVRNTARKLLSEHPTAKFLITGHSLGGALATLAGADIKIYLKNSATKVYLYTLGSPRVGNPEFANELFTLFKSGRYYRIINYDDTVPNSLGQNINLLVTVYHYKHAGDEIWYFDSTDPQAFYRVCQNKINEPENLICSMSHKNSWTSVGLHSHLNYFGIDHSTLCYIAHPTNTRL